MVVRRFLNWHLFDASINFVNLAIINRTWSHEDLKSLRLTGNVRLAQLVEVEVG